MRSILSTPVLFAATFTFGQSAPNQDCAHAQPLAVSSTNIQIEWTMQTLGAGDAVPLVPPAACAGSGNQYARWYSFVATANTHWIRSDRGATSFVVEAFSGSCGSLTSIHCAANAGPIQLTGLSAGSTYYFRIFIYSSFDQIGPDETYGVAVVSAPDNDECANARELFAKPGSSPLLPSTETSTLAATQSQPGCATAAASNDDVWYRFTATQNNHWLYTTVFSMENMITQWFSGSCGNLTSIGCNTSTAGNLTPGQTYYIRQYTQSTDVNVSIRALIDLYSVAPNDECVGAIPVEVALDQEDPVSYSFSYMASTSSTVPCNTTSYDVWVSFTAPSATVIAQFDQNVTSTLFSGSCASLTCVASGSSDLNVLTDLIPGDTYFLKLGSSVPSNNHSLRLLSPPTNDDCPDAIALSVQPGGAPFDWTFGSTFAATQSMPGCNGAAESDDDVWYRFTAQDTAQLLYLRSLFHVSTLRVELFNGDCNNLVSTFCSPAFNGSMDKLRLGQLNIGTEYRFRVYTTVGGRTGLRLAITGTLPNDNCSGAILLTSNALSDYTSIQAIDGNLTTNGTGGCAITRDIWYRFVATGGSATFLAPPSPSFDVELLSGTCGSLTSITCRTGVVRAAFNGLTVGQQYFLRYSAPATYRVRPMLFLAPPNDEIAGATLLDPTGSTYASNAQEAWTYGATRSLSRLCSGQGVPDDDVWFKFVATASAHGISVQDQNLRFATTPLSFGLLIEAYDPLTLDSAGLAQGIIGCGNGMVALSGLTVGHTIYFRVYSYLGGVSDVTGFLVSVNTGSNDDGSGAMPISYGNDYTVLYNTSGATQSQAAANCSVDDFPDDDIWFKFIANGSPSRLVSSHHDADLTLELFSGTPGNLTSIVCSDNILVLPDNLSSGQTYYARLYSWKNNTPVSGRLGLFTSPSITANGCVDEDCLGPVLLVNPGFEQGGVCMPNTPQLSGGDGNTLTPLAPGWYDYFYTTPDSYNSCADFDLRQEVPQRPGPSEVTTIRSRNGKGMAGIFAVIGQDYREHQSGPLSELLVPGEPYLISYYLACRPFASFHPVNGFGALLTTGAPTSVYDLVPQVLDLRIIDGEGWQNICGIVVADQAYDHITIGNFLEFNEQSFYGNVLQSSYYFLDDVVVAHIDNANCITGFGDAHTLDQGADGGSGDDLRIYPNPASDRVNIVCDAGLFGQRGVIEVFDVTGKRVHQEQVNYLSALQPLELSHAWREGLYLVMARVEGQAPKAARVVIER